MVGKGGSVVREIGTRARPEIEHLLGHPVFLDLHVKVRPQLATRRGDARAPRASEPGAPPPAVRPRQHALAHERPARRRGAARDARGAVRRVASRGRDRTGRPRRADLAAYRAAGARARGPRRGTARWRPRCLVPVLRRALPGAALRRRHARLARRAGRRDPARAAGRSRPPPRPPHRQPGADGPRPPRAARPLAFLPGRRRCLRLRGRVARGADPPRASPRRRLAGRRDVEVGDTRRDVDSAHEASIDSIRVDASGLAGAARQLLARAGAGSPRATLRPWRRRPRSRPASSFRSSRGCRGSGRSTRSRSRSAPRRSPSGAIKREAKLFALELAVRMTDLTTLEGAGHARQGRRARLEGDSPRSRGCERSLGGRALRLPEPRAHRGRAARGQRREGGVGRDRVPLRPVADSRSKVDEVRWVVRARRRRGRHGDRPRRVPVGALREGLRRDRPREGGLRRRAPEGDPRDRRARHLRQRAARVAARDRRGRRLHQDLDGQAAAGRDAARDARDARGDPRRLRGDRAARSA